MTENILTVCDALVTALVAGLDDPNCATVERVYLAPVDLKSEQSRRVWVFPASYQHSPASRGENEWIYQVGVIVAERYADAGEPTVAWLDERVEFTQTQVFTALDHARELLAFGTDGTRRLWTQTGGCEVVYDADRLSTQKLFWSELRFEFREIQNA